MSKKQQQGGEQTQQQQWQRRRRRLQGHTVGERGGRSIRQQQSVTQLGDGRSTWTCVQQQAAAGCLGSTQAHTHIDTVQGGLWPSRVAQLCTRCPCCTDPVRGQARCVCRSSASLSACAALSAGGMAVSWWQSSRMLYRLRSRSSLDTRPNSCSHLRKCGQGGGQHSTAQHKGPHVKKMADLLLAA